LTLQLRRRLFKEFKLWVEDSTKRSLEEMFSSKEGRDQFCQAFGRYCCKS
jgi:hypothetical protein